MKSGIKKFLAVMVMVVVVITTVFTTSVVAFGTDNGYILAFTFCPINDEGFQPVCGIIMASIQSI